MQLRSTVDHNKSIKEEVTTLKKDFKQKEDKYIEEFLDIKKLKEKVEDRLFKQDQSVQTVHMYVNPKPFWMKEKVHDQIIKPCWCMTRKETLEIAKLNRKRMYEKMKSLQCIQNKVKFTPPDYSKENYLAIFTPQRDLTPEQIFWAKDENDRKKVKASVLKPLSTPIVYPPNTPVKLVPRELLECVIGTCPKSFNERDNKAPSTPVTRKKQVTFSDKPGTSSRNTQKHKVYQRVQQTNIPVLPSTRVNDSTEASGSKPRGNTKKNKILPAKKKNKKEVEVRLRKNKSVWTKVNLVDSSISSKRVVINSNSKSKCKTCNKCLNSANHEMCVVNSLNSVHGTPTVHIALNKADLTKRFGSYGKLLQITRTSGFGKQRANYLLILVINGDL
ncbi:hypothetical protein Tco_0448205 [Tanacetum coccineum]